MAFRVLFSLLLLAVFRRELMLATGYSSGAPNCQTNAPCHGSNVGNPGYSFTLTRVSDGVAVTSYTPGTSYTISLKGPSFRGYFYGVFRSNPNGVFSAPKAGTLSVGSGGWAPCAGTQTQLSGTSRTAASSTWVAPAAGTGSVFIYALVTPSRSSNVYFSATITEAVEAPSSTGTATPASTASPTAPVTGTRSASVSPAPPSLSNTPTSSVTASASPVSPTPTRSSSSLPTASLSTGATPSVSATASASPLVFPYATALSSQATLRWRLDPDPFPLKNTVRPSKATFRLEADGERWLALGRSSCNSMLSGCPGPVIIGRLDTADGNGVASQHLITARDTTGIVPLSPSLSIISSNESSVEVLANGARLTTVLTYSRPLNVTAIAASSRHPSELSVDETVEQGYVFALGRQGTSEFRKHDEKGFFLLKLYPAACDRANTCSGRGSCVLVNNSLSYCSCDLGYNGTACSSCGPGFERALDSSGSCDPVQSAAANATTAVKVQMKLGIPFSTVTANREAFVTSLTADLAAALSVPASRINITGLRSGSVIAEFVLLPPSATETAARLAAAAANTSSALYLGTFTQHLDVSASPLSFESFVIAEPSPSPLPPVSSGGGGTNGTTAAASKYDRTVSLRDDLQLSWRLYKSTSSTNDLIAIRLRYTGQSWFSFGVAANSNLEMLNADVILVQPGFPDGSQVTQAVLLGYQLMDVEGTESDEESFPLGDLAVTTTTDAATNVTTMVVEATRTLAAGKYPGALRFAASGATPVTWAVGFPGDKVLGMHQSFGTGFLDLTSGKLDTTQLNRDLRISHGSFMAAAFGLIFPIGIFFSRFGKRLYPQRGPQAKWLCCHRSFQVVGLVFALTGFALAVAFVQRQGSVHFKSVHSLLGLAVFLLALLQPLNALLRPRSPADVDMPSSTSKVRRPREEDEEESTFHKALVLAWSLLHRSLGYCAAVGGSANIFLGFFAYGLASSSAPFVLYALLVALLAAFFIWREGRVRGWWWPLPPLDSSVYFDEADPVVVVKENRSARAAGAAGAARAARAARPDPVVVRVGNRPSRVAAALGPSYSNGTAQNNAATRRRDKGGRSRPGASAPRVYEDEDPGDDEGSGARSSASRKSSRSGR